MNNICQLFDRRFCQLTNTIINSKIKKFSITYHCYFQVGNFTLTPLIKRIYLLTLLCFPQGLRCFSLEVSSWCSSRSREVMSDPFLLLSHYSVRDSCRAGALVPQTLGFTGRGTREMLPEQHHKLQPYTEHTVQAGGQPQPRIWSKMPEGQQIPDSEVLQPTSR